MAHPRPSLFVLCGLVPLAVGVAISSSCSSGKPATVTSTTSRKLPPLRQRRARQRILFVDELAGAFGAIYSIRLDGKGLRRVVTNAYTPALSPDRKHLAYTQGSGGVVVARADGTHRRSVVSEAESIDDAPAWSPDGRKLVFVSTVSPSPSGGLFEARLFTVNANGSASRRLKHASFRADNPGPSWIDARHLLITAELGKLAIISSQTGRTQRQIRLPYAGSQPAADPATLSPSRRAIAYVECDNSDCSSTSVDLITLRGRLIRRIRGASSPAWSAQGDLLLYACCEQPGIRGNTSQIFFAPAGGGPGRAITPISLSGGEPVWFG
jgi:WD40 repeat protein